MKLRTLFLAVLAACVLQISARAQMDFEDLPPLPPWEQFKLDPKVRISLNFRNANPDAVLERLSQASGVAIVKDPSLTVGLTLQSPRPQTLKDAFAMLNAALTLRNFSLTKEGNFLVVKPSQPQRGFGRFGGGGDLSGLGGGRGGAQQMLRVYNIKYANASQVARVINEVFANANNQPSFQQPGVTPGGPGGGGGGFPGRRRGGGNFGGVSYQTPGDGGPPPPDAPSDFQGAGGGVIAQGQGGGGFQGVGGGRRGAAAADTAQVKASADDFSNSVIVNAPSREQDQIEHIITQIDKQTDQPQQSKVFSLKYANATDLAPIVQNVLVSNAPRGRGGIGAQNVPIDQRFQQAVRFGSTQASFGQVAPDARTNSLIVTATTENLDTISKLIDQLDKPATYASNSFVFTLQNARADLVAQTLNQSFNSRTGSTTTTAPMSISQSAYGGTSNASRTSTSNSNGPPTLNGRAVPRTSDTVGSRAAETRAADPRTPAADPAPEPQTFGGFGGRGGGGLFGAGGSATSNQSHVETGVSASGQVVNIHDLSGQVIAVPDISTNSIIVVTSPENQEILQKVLQQLDKIPQQVMIETLIVEATLDKTTQFGIEWNFTSGSFKSSQGFGLQGNTTQPQGLNVTLSNSQYGAFLQALQTDTRFQVLSTPRIFTTNNATADINISQSLPYVTSQTVDTNGAYFYNYSFLDVGIVLTVTPRITANGYVTMDVSQTANDFVNYTSFNAPVVNQREANTTVSVKDGETVVLGGIIQNQTTDTINKIPILGDIPLLGKLFQSKNLQKTKTELLVFLTPHVVRDETEARKLREQTESQLEPNIQKTLKDYRASQKAITPTTPQPDAKSNTTPTPQPDAKPNTTPTPPSPTNAPQTPPSKP